MYMKYSSSILASGMSGFSTSIAVAMVAVLALIGAAAGFAVWRMKKKKKSASATAAKSEIVVPNRKTTSQMLTHGLSSQATHFSKSVLPLDN